MDSRSEEDKSKNKFNSHCQSLFGEKRRKGIDFEGAIVEIGNNTHLKHIWNWMCDFKIQISFWLRQFLLQAYKVLLMFMIFDSGCELNMCATFWSYIWPLQLFMFFHFLKHFLPKWTRPLKKGPKQTFVNGWAIFFGPSGGFGPFLGAGSHCLFWDRAKK